ncbi:MAG: aspartate--tRNA ligase [Opitutales bacterium]
MDTIRDHGGLVFVDLRDREGLTQIVFDPQNPTFAQVANELKPESVIGVTGTVQPRPQETVNARLATGEIELIAEALDVHNISAPLPFPLGDDKVGEDLRLKYRYLDLRNPRRLNLLRLRHQASGAIRRYLDEQGFLEIEMPTLFKSTPEGAREFLVPSRLNPGNFYALAQSPQQYKQILMVAGVERYYSMARCYRDEDLRADRQPEFTQVDLELSFIDREDIYALIEGMLQRVWKEALGVSVEAPFPRMPYNEVMNRYGVDKPDTRFNLELKDFTETFKNSEFKVFASAAQSGGCVKAFNAKGLSDITQGELKNLEDIAKTLGAKGLAFIKAEEGGWKSPILKFLSDDEQATLKESLNIEPGDLIFFAATEWERACAILGRIRLEAAQLLVQRERLEIPKDQYNFLWVVDFPLMSYDEEVGSYAATHHPFTAPVPEDIPLLDTDPKSVRGQHYDIVLNGVELGGGSIRIHQPAVQKKVFEEVLNIPKDLVKSRFGYMLEAFKYGAPPHGGIALGFDRLAAILGGQSSIREVVAFPKTQRGQDLMSESPGPASEKQLEDLFIRSVPPVG